jgi:hypothetical protein
MAYPRRSRWQDRMLPPARAHLGRSTLPMAPPAVPRVDMPPMAPPGLLPPQGPPQIWGDPAGPQGGADQPPVFGDPAGPPFQQFRYGPKPPQVVPTPETTNQPFGMGSRERTAGGGGK